MDKVLEKALSLRIYLIFYFVTAMGSNLSAVATFLQIEPTFNSIWFLSFALSLKTLLLAFASELAVKAIQRFGLWLCLAGSQILGILFLIVVALGFEDQNYPLALIGMLGIGLPSVFLGIISTVNIKLLTNSSEQYLKNQGNVGILGGLGFLIATIISPLLLSVGSLRSVLVIDALTYLIALLILYYNKSHFVIALNNEEAQLPKSRLKLSISNVKVLRLRPYLIFSMTLASIYILKGLPPMLAGSSVTGFSVGSLETLRQTFWSLEAATLIISGWIYKQFSKAIFKQSISDLFMLNTILIGPLFLMQSLSMVAVVLGGLCLTMSIGMMKARDDLVIASVGKQELERASAYAWFFSNLMMTVSPIIISLSIIGPNPLYGWIVLVTVQFILWRQTKKLR